MKVGIVGTGFVGASAAYALTLRGSCTELVLVDINEKKALAEAEDIQHATPFTHPVRVTAGNYKDLADAKVVILTAGVNQKPGETRLQLLERNVKIFAEMVPQVVKAAKDAILIVATNPVDVLTAVTAKIAGLPEGRVLGSGTTLDTARFRALVGQHVGIDPQHVHAFVLGEHGDSEVLAWSGASISGIPIGEYCVQRGIEWNDKTRKDIDEKVRKAAYTIIEGKGATYYGIGAALARITEVITRDARAILSVTAPDSDGLAYALPRIVGGEGIRETLEVPLSTREAIELSKSVEVLKEATGQAMGYLND
ncbi:L-lactate dehydrogenase [Deinococcus cellulosilyticus]|uniref:L-lactate dehydrogenase n=1 Tax=Deinococcus cellulosilyticus (strain DSM 18568 / NBRC 106333 / KACC 11606 / 5516J-15) TaxID=1223518 RepID=A0A511N5J7_DEIC1|nr:L-lactate dehydrogenase [Deinococcus cellulosilyticus]GEM48104.1 L-lactate dehydrogenase [Deinococcus cellulosilyticus NBRC 106333 = KACC 11606]